MAAGLAQLMRAPIDALLSPISSRSCSPTQRLHSTSTAPAWIWRPRAAAGQARGLPLEHLQLGNARKQLPVSMCLNARTCCSFTLLELA